MTESPTVERVRRTLRDRCGVGPGESVIAAVSGGADSVALACCLDRIRDASGISLSLVHINHGLRGGASDRDQSFVEALGADLGVPVDVVVEDVGARARDARVSVEMAGRACRLEAYRKVAVRRGAGIVATGHTRQDRAETVLMRLIRGSGTAGLSGMRYAVEFDRLRVVRPLLDCTRGELETVLRDRGQGWCEDATNADDRFMRNRVRRELMPLLRERFNPQVDEALARAAEILAEEDGWLASEAEARLDGCRSAEDPGVLERDRLMRVPRALRRRVILGWIREQRPGSVPDAACLRRLDDQLERRDGTAQVPLSGGASILREYGKLRIAQASDADGYARCLPVPGSVELPGCGLRAEAEVISGGDPRRPGRMGQWPAEGCIRMNAAVLEGLVVRTSRDGDRVAPTGMDGSLKLQDVFVNEKVPRAARGTYPVFEAGGEIVWVPGYRVSRDWAVESAAGEFVRLRVQPGTAEEGHCPPGRGVQVRNVGP